MSNQHGAPLTRERTYLRVQPTTEQLDPALVEQTVDELYTLLQPADSGRLLSFSQPAPSTLEILLVARGRGGQAGDRQLGYYISIEDGDVEDVERVLRRCVPTGYELSVVSMSFADLTGLDETPPPGDEEVTVSGARSAAVEFRGAGELRGDWQTGLRPFRSFAGEATSRWPLGRVVDAMMAADVPVVFQTLVEPKADWSGQAATRIDKIRYGKDTIGGKLVSQLMEPSTDVSESELSKRQRGRIDQIRDMDGKRSYTVNARAVAFGTESTPDGQLAGAIERMSSAVHPIDGEYYHIRPRTHGPESADASSLFEAVMTRTLRRTPQSRLRRLVQRLPVTSNARPELVMDSSTLPNLMLLGGPDLPGAVDRAVGTRRPDESAMQLPPQSQLEHYLSSKGMTLGQPITADDTVLDQTVSLPPELQPLHTVIFGGTGSGKSYASLRAQLSNANATDGADVVIAPKGDGMAVEYIRAHYARTGSLEDVYYFDCSETLPALSVCDIRPQLAAGIPREQAVENVVDHYRELLAGFMGEERYERAVRSPDIIAYLIKALFDPVHGSDAFGHDEFEQTAARMHETRDAPPVSDPRLREKLGGVAANSQRSFDELMQGVANRIEKATRDRRLATLFDHAPADPPSEEASSPVSDGGTASQNGSTRFDFLQHLEEDCLIVFDTSGYRDNARRMLTLVLLSKLWTALKRRAAHDDGTEDSLVNLYVEEAADVASSGILADLLSQGRGFGLAVTLSMQFPRQLRTEAPRIYWELLNDVATVLVGRVGVDPDLAERLATDAEDADAVANRLRQLDRGEWLLRMPAPFGDTTPKPFRCRSLPLPPGHPDGPEPFDTQQEDLFDAALLRSKSTTETHHGLDVTETTTESVQPNEPSASSAFQDGPPIHRNLAYSKRLPECVYYKSAADAVVCQTCDTRYGAHREGLHNAIECCHSFDDVDRDNVPVCGPNLTMSRNERDGCPYSDRQLVFLQTVYDTQQQRFDSEYGFDIVWDSMVRLREYTGIDQSELDELLDDGVLVRDCKQPHGMFSVPSEGRAVLKEGHREGIAHGHERGDLSESSLHVMMVETCRRYLETAYAQTANSGVTRVVAYYERDGHRYDCVALDDHDNIIIAVEAERSNHDTLRAVPEDFDKIAAQTPEEAIWIVKNREAAHDVLNALNQPPEGPPRVQKTYSENTAPDAFQINTPGLTDVHTIAFLRDKLLAETPPE